MLVPCKTTSTVALNGTTTTFVPFETIVLFGVKRPLGLAREIRSVHTRGPSCVVGLENRPCGVRERDVVDRGREFRPVWPLTCGVRRARGAPEPHREEKLSIDSLGDVRRETGVGEASEPACEDAEDGGVVERTLPGEVGSRCHWVGGVCGVGFGAEEDVGGLTWRDEEDVRVEGLHVDGVGLHDSDGVAGNAEEELVVQGSVDQTEEVRFPRMRFRNRNLTEDDGDLLVGFWERVRRVFGGKDDDGSINIQIAILIEEKSIRSDPTTIDKLIIG
ncbi:(Dimethylallyl)adenosine tRNAmethylthiotransferase MiaB [Striga asiatica]|uniref:(Dimethylallyl)adenosine tRNAmethylthiotransferase MiaB n=1 Tax=Striga asiatica TaxID=4170 RepID=A0A5A7PQL4_STRAF|nr:(Dimethylallyl)adenosine tRNAmethylthiotransferase MiaB [Striga asiatica]